MLRPLVQGLHDNDNELVANELQYYVNCDTCSELVSTLKRKPNDELLIDFLSTISINVCAELIDRELCESLNEKFKAYYMSHFFNLFVTEEFACGYILPLCEKHYAELSVQDFAWGILKDKPVVI
jgi:hypothetical protein